MAASVQLWRRRGLAAALGATRWELDAWTAYGLIPPAQATKHLPGGARRLWAWDRTNTPTRAMGEEIRRAHTAMVALESVDTCVERIKGAVRHALESHTINREDWHNHAISVIKRAWPSCLSVSLVRTPLRRRSA